MYVTCSSLLFLFLLQCTWFVSATDITYTNYLQTMDDEEEVIPVDDSVNDMKILPEYYGEPVAEAFFSDLLKKLVHRLDLVSCEDTIANIPNPNQARRYKTTICYKKGYRCIRIKNKDEFESYFFHRDQMKIARRIGKDSYNLLEYYHIQCPKDHNCKLNITNVDLENRVKLGSVNVCLDYISVQMKNDNREICGHETLTNYSFNDDLNITFRGRGDKVESSFTITVFAFKNKAAVATENCLMPNNDFSAEKYLQYAALASSDEKFEDAIYFWNEDYVRSPKHAIPYGSAKKLLKFYMDNHRTFLFTDLMESTNNNGILRLAVLAEKSCDSLESKIAQNVISLFPQSMVDQIKMSYQGTN